MRNKEQLQSNLRTLKQKRLEMLAVHAKRMLPNLEEGTRDGVFALYPRFSESEKTRGLFSRAISWKPNIFMAGLYGTEQCRTNHFSSDIEYLRAQLTSVLDEVGVLDDSDYKTVTDEIDGLDNELAAINQLELAALRRGPRVPDEGNFTTLGRSSSFESKKPTFSKPPPPVKRDKTVYVDRPVERVVERTVYVDNGPSLTDILLINALTNNNNHGYTPTPAPIQAGGGGFDGGGASGSWDDNSTTTTPAVEQTASAVFAASVAGDLGSFS